MAHTMLYFHSFLVFFVWTRFAFAQVPRVIEFNVTWIKAAPDGYERDVITINGVWPLSPIHVAKNEVYMLRVYNGLNDGECITGIIQQVMQSLMPVHTHGIDQWGSNPYDGVDLVTQWYSSPFPWSSGSVLW